MTLSTSYKPFFVRSSSLDGALFCFSLPRGHGRQQKKQNKHTLNTRGCSFGVPLNSRGCLTRTPHGALKGTKARTRTEKTSYSIPGCTILHLMQMSDSVPCRCYILIHVAACDNMIFTMNVKNKKYSALTCLTRCDKRDVRGRTRIPFQPELPLS